MMYDSANFQILNFSVKSMGNIIIEIALKIAQELFGRLR